MNRQTSTILTLFGALCLMPLLTGDAETDTVTVLLPFPADTTSYDTGRLFIVSVAGGQGTGIVASSQWEKTEQVDLSSPALKEAFPKTFIALIPPSATLQSATFTRRFFKGYSVPDTLAYRYADTVTLEDLWADPAFTTIVKTLQAPEALAVIITLRGWVDTAMTTEFEDPASPGRALYKIPIRLVPGKNELYFAPSGNRSLASAFPTAYEHASTSIADRGERFHNSPIEAGCVSCHDGLPSASDGASMSADCAGCHREHALADFLHAPVEMKECATCHAWSAERKAMVVEAGVPATCYACHEEKQAAVDSSAHPHAVASECATCHSPHGSDRKHLLKDDVNRLCEGCHEGFGINHPVGRHPVRFSVLQATGEELSCVSCHTPHGGEHPKLLIAGNASMEICSKCH